MNMKKHADICNFLLETSILAPWAVPRGRLTRASRRVE